ncbi:MAG: glycosyltransferase, partial [Verrucomicrobia bacterium]
MTPPLSVIIPTLNEERALPATLRRLRSALPDAEIIVADGGSRDDTTTLARQSGARAVASPPGRGHQCRAGAAAARGAWLLFLHADTLLPPDADPVIATFARTSSRPIATFRLRFDTGSVFLRACAWFSRFDTVFTRFGDQGILVARALYDALGGIPDWPLMEDVEFLRRARRRIG